MNQQVDNEIGGYVAAENKHAARLLGRGEIAVLLDRWNGVERRFHDRRNDQNNVWRLGQPRPQAERRVREDRRGICNQ